MADESRYAQGDDAIEGLLAAENLTLTVRVTSKEQVTQLLAWFYTPDRTPFLSELKEISIDHRTVGKQGISQLKQLAQRLEQEAGRIGKLVSDIEA